MASNFQFSKRGSFERLDANTAVLQMMPTWLTLQQLSRAAWANANVYFLPNLPNASGVAVAKEEINDEMTFQVANTQLLSISAGCTHHQPPRLCLLQLQLAAFFLESSSKQRGMEAVFGVLTRFS